ncbi:TetR/AcrR family transcriptional regulator [Leekyejoonella antrihumi]|uniref:TetR/AcrR family transcriptional regulator n=1 Tax=Leekyejoonella antrihumi TaxID=1660198 RepID=A0A563DVJ6_9MICO|nr:TetR/AcrR family transcriptional regulator [Leekyejoonella antrihumi]TWP34215.1 TetR/AcrR family transcriptional regulator [Leekyejoonella antrihumi]
MGDSPAAERVLRAAVSAFAELGFHGASTREIAARAGMSPAAVYTHFRSKEDLLFGISLDSHEQVLAALHRAAAQGVTPPERMSSIMYEFTLFHARGRAGAWVANNEIAILTAEHARQIKALRRQMMEVVRSVIEAGLRTQDFHTSDPSMTCTALMTLSMNVERWYREDGRWSPEDIATHYRDLALRMLGVTS